MSKSKTKRSLKPNKATKKATPASPDAQERAAMTTFLNEGRFAELEALFRAWTVRFPRYVSGWQALGALLKQQERNAEALTPIRNITKLLPENANAHFHLGNILLELGQTDDAAASFRRALELKQDYVEAYGNLGNTLSKLGQLDDAVANYNRALEIKPDFAEVHSNIGNALQELGQLVEAAAHCRLALEIKPDFAEAHNNLGSILHRQGLLEEAIAHFEQALVLAPKYEDAKFSLCHSLYSFSLVNRDKAKQLASRARELFRDDQIILRGISGILGQTNISQDEILYTRELFNRFAAKFESTLNSLKYNTPKDIADELNLDSAGTDKALDILDAGCGTGLCGAYLKPAARTLVGVDLSAEMLRLAREKHIYDSLYEDDIISFMQKNKASFDLIVSADVLIYIGDIQYLVESIFVALRQNGVIAISTECMESNEFSDTFALQPSGRYQHSIKYLQRS